MTEDDARDWLTTHFPGRLGRLERFVALLAAEAERQSLIARSTFLHMWSRHIADSAQLVLLAASDGLWLDVGSGGGLPGIVVAILRDQPILMSEPRRKRVEFLGYVIERLQLSNARATVEKVQSISEPARIISARAVAPIHNIFTWTKTNVSRETRYLLPRGASFASELAIARHAWHGTFHVEQSLTDPQSGIIVAEAVRPR